MNLFKNVFGLIYFYAITFTGHKTTRILSIVIFPLAKMESIGEKLLQLGMMGWLS